MNKLKLSILFESVLNNSIDLSKYPNLQKLVDYYKNFKIEGKYIIKPDDFNILTNRNDPGVKDVFALIGNGSWESEYENSSPSGRVYNFAKGLRIKLNKTKEPAYRAAFDELLDLFTDVTSSSASVSPQQTPSVNQQKSNNLAPNKIQSTSLQKTNSLKNNNTVTIDKVPYIIDDEVISIFQNNGEDPEVMKYKAAMDNDDLSLPDDPTSEAGLIYSLYKKLKSSCTELLSSYTNIKDRLGNINFIPDKGRKDKSISSVNNLNLSSLHRGAEVKITYKLYNVAGSYYNNQNNIYSSTFVFKELTKNYQFVNKKDKNNSFVFLKGKVPAELERGYKYDVVYDTQNIEKIHLIFEVLNIEATSSVEVSNFSDFESCASMDELIDLLGLDN